MNSLSFRTRINLLTFSLVLLSIASSTLFFLYLYRKDRIESVFESEKLNTNQLANHIKNTLVLANAISPEKVADSSQIIALFENVCTQIAAPQSVVSNYYLEQMKNLEVEARQLYDEQALRDICASAQDLADSLIIVPAGVKIAVPYLVLLMKNQVNVGQAPLAAANLPAQSAQSVQPPTLGNHRLAVIALDGFTTASNNTFFLVDSKGKMLWAADGIEYVRNALAETEIYAKEYSDLIEKVIHLQNPAVEYAGRYAIVSYAHMISPQFDWAVLSLTYRPSVFQPIYFAMLQSLFLVFALFFLCILVANRFVGNFSKPLEELKTFADELALGHFNLSLKVEGPSEVQSVKKAFNTMSTRIVQLIDSSREQGHLETELELAQEIQKMLIPSTPIKSQYFQLASYVKNAAKCGGDWWGFIEVPNTDSTLKPYFITFIGDVTGHGVASALITGIAKGSSSLLQQWIQETPGLAFDPCRMMTLFNKAIYESTLSRISMTFFIAIIDPNKNTLTVANAGHNFPYLIQEGKVKPLGKGGVPLGSALDTAYTESETHPWTVGSKMFLYTDGLTDCNDSEGNSLFDKRDLRKILQKNANFTGKQLFENLIRERNKKAAHLPQPDDITALCVEQIAVSNRAKG